MAGSKNFQERYAALYRSDGVGGKKLARYSQEAVDGDSVSCASALPIMVSRDKVHRSPRVPMPVNDDVALRPYQNEAIQRVMNEWRNVKSVMLQMPTGTGKTRLFVSLVNHLMGQGGAHRPSKLQVLIVTHREELVEQISETLGVHYGLEHGVLQGANTRDLTSNIIVASIQSLAAGLRSGAKQMKGLSPNYIIIDEAHHALADSYTELLEHYPKAYKLGVTATPYRLKKRSFKPLFQSLVLSQGIADFIAQGYLADYRFFTVGSEQAALQRVNRLTKFNPSGDYQVKDLQDIYANSAETEQLYDCYDRQAKGCRGIVYAVNQLHAEMIAACFASHGVKAASIDCKTPAKVRKELIRQFRNGELQVLVNVELFCEGFDCPDIEFAMLARPTRSLALYLQQVGRALRPTPGGKPVVILDCVGLHNRFGLPERERSWAVHFNGWKSEKETYTRPLGQPSGGDDGEMIDVSPLRDSVSASGAPRYEVFRDTVTRLYGINRNGMVSTKAVFRSLTQTDGGWFHGRDDEGALVILDTAGRVVFRMQNSDIALHADGTFSIIVVSAGERFTIGPFNSRMNIPSQYINAVSVSYLGFYTMTLYRIVDSNVMLTSYHLSSDCRFYKKVFPVGTTYDCEGGLAYIDLDNKIYKQTRAGSIQKWHIPEVQVRRFLMDDTLEYSLWAK